MVPDQSSGTIISYAAERLGNGFDNLTTPRPASEDFALMLIKELFCPLFTEAAHAGLTAIMLKHTSAITAIKT
jgi:hypothetical protein